MTFSYDLSTNVGMARLLIPDRDPDNAFFQDEEIETFLALEGSVRRAAAQGLEVLAGDEAYVQKVITTLNLTTNGPATAKALMDRAEKLREQDEMDDPSFDIAEQVFDPFTRRERLYKERQRGGL